MEHEKISIAVPALRTIGNFLSSPFPELAALAIDAGVLELFARLIDHPKQALRKELIWCVANVTAESTERVQACLDVGLVRSMILHM